MPNRIQGKIKFFKEDAGYGFIVRDDGKGDVFVHRTAFPIIPDRIDQDTRVAFDTEPGKKGLRAVNVALV